MLAMIEDIWWPRIHRGIIDQARYCEQCLESGKNLKCILGQKQIGKLPEVKQQNEEIALGFYITGRTLDFYIAQRRKK